MGKAHGSKRRKGKSFNYNINRKNLWKKSKKMPHIKCAAIREAWEPNKGVYRNLQEMGLVADPNKHQRIPSAAIQFKEQAGKLDSNSTPKKKQKLRKGFVVDALVEEASKPRDTTFHVSNEIGMFAKYMVDKYGDDYKAMAKDPRNYYQQTPKQIKKAIEDFRVSKYLDALRIVKKLDKNSSQTTS